MQRTLIKFCGLTRPADAELAESLGADFLGMNFFAGPRKITRETAREILAAISKAIPVALTASDLREYVDAPSPNQIIGDFSPLPIHTFQVYGEWPPEVLERSNKIKCWSVESISDRQSLEKMIERYRRIQPHVAAIVVDTAVKGQLGGTGKTFDWNWIAEARAAGTLEKIPPIVLAGGLTEGNVADAIRIVRPYTVDVSSGIESGTPGIKDAGKMKAFIEAVRAADNELA